MKGIYAYFDKETEKIVYIGKDSYIHKNERHKKHLQPSKYDEQTINRVLQNNPNRYIYKPIHICHSHLTNDDLNGLEIQYIEALNPKFNFTEGGDGMLGFKHSEATLKKLRDNHPKPMLGKNHSKETRRKMSNSAKLRHKIHPHSAETRRKMSENHWDCSGENNPNYGREFSIEHRKRISESKKGENHPRWKDYPRIIKYGHYKGKQQYTIMYKGKVVKTSIYKDKLEKELKKLKESFNEH